jgi:hypothetical protein
MGEPNNPGPRRQKLKKMGLPTGLFLLGDVSATAESIFNLNISANLKSYFQSFRVQNRSQREKFDQKKQRIEIS